MWLICRCLCTVDDCVVSIQYFDFHRCGAVFILCLRDLDEQNIYIRLKTIYQINDHQYITELKLYVL